MDSIVVEAFLALESMSSMAALVGGRIFPGFFWSLFAVSAVLSAAAFVDCRSFVLVGGGPLDEVDIPSACSSYFVFRNLSAPRWAPIVES